MPQTTTLDAANSAVLTGEQVLSIAQHDAIVAYGDLSPFSIHLVLEVDGWHIDYQLKNPKHKGGGPHYVIDATSGAIIAKRYEQ